MFQFIVDTVRSIGAFTLTPKVRPIKWLQYPKRMHSSRMRTARSLPYGGISMTETPPLDLPWRDCPPRQSLRPPPPCGQTDTCENITFTNFVCGAIITLLSQCSMNTSIQFCASHFFIGLDIGFNFNQCEDTVNVQLFTLATVNSEISGVSLSFESWWPSRASD